MAPAPRVVFIVCSLLAGRAAQAQPLFFIGRADAALQGAFSYEFLRSPLDYPAGQGQVVADFNLPVDAAGGTQRWIGRLFDSSVVVPSLFGRVQQVLNAGISASAPVGPGVLFFAAGENASLRVTAALGDATFALDTTLSAGTVRLKGSVYLPLLFDVHWRSMTLGYAWQPADWLRVGFQVHRHEVLASVGGDLSPDLAGRVETSGLAFDVQYTSDQVFGNADGTYRGVAYNPEMAVQAGPVRAVARLPASLKATGQMVMNYQVPFFIDAETFQPQITQADSFLTPANLSRLLNGETNARTWVFRDPLRFTLPGSVTLALELWRNRLELSYTKIFGSLGVASEASPADTDATALHSQGYLDAAVAADNLFLLRWETAFFHGCLGLHSLNLSYRNQANLLSGYSPWEWDGDPLAPVVQFGFLWGDPLQFHLDFDITPVPALRTGVGYRF